MAHHTVRSGYQSFVERINRFPQGAAPTPTLFKILQLLMSEQEARYVSLLPIRSFGISTAAAAWHVPETEARSILDTLASRGIILDTENPHGVMEYSLPPPMAGFFEFSLMRIRGDIDQKVLSELYYQYMNVEDDFIKGLFCDGETRLGRTFVYEPAVQETLSLHILDHEKVSEVIGTATHRAVGVCYCRHKMSHLGKACDAPTDICMTFNNTAESLIRHNIARSVDVSECTDLLHQAYDRNLVQFGENVRESVNFICNCCGCCCEAMLAAKRFAFLHPVHTTNYLPVVMDDQCTGCAKCIDVCPVEAMGLVNANDPLRRKRKKAQVREDVCLGCGLCVKVCSKEAMTLKKRTNRVITPLNSAHKAVVMAIERGMLQHLIYDNRMLWNHRAMAAVLGVILSLPPIKQVMATQQIKSRYMEWLVRRANVT
ncbi:MAG: 4Fe-4S dicluster domain-containing protein [Ignavibacteriales bacterium]|nr:4Fe-4S dicluster domain-containing protein [Ignavibacteriales bacterium]